MLTGRSICGSGNNYRLRLNVPKKIRELKAMLRKAGFFYRPAKGSHTVWEHPALTDSITISGADGDDAQRYQEAAVRKILNKLREVQSE